MADNLVVMVSIATALMLILLLVYLQRLLRVTIADFWENESIETPLTIGLGLVFFAILLSFINIGIVQDPIPLSINVTGAIIPLFISIYIITSKRVNLVAALASILIVTPTAFLVTSVSSEAITVNIVLWLLPVAVSGVLGYFWAKNKEQLSSASLAYFAASMGMFIGGDLARIPTFVSAGGHSLILGGSGLMDFVFLAGPFSIAVLWVMYGTWTLLKKKSTFRNLIPGHGLQ
jgi:uncharacterized membrane protein